MRTIRSKQVKGLGRGQNLVELALTFPILLIVILSIVEVGRAWNTFEGARMAAMDGSYTAAIYQNVGLGKVQIQNRLDSANISVDSGSADPRCSTPVDVTESNGTYNAKVCVVFKPIFSDLNINIMGNDTTLFPNEIPIVYENVNSSVIY